MNIYKFDSNSLSFGLTQTIKPNAVGDLFSAAAINDNNCRIITSMGSATGNYINIYEGIESVLLTQTISDKLLTKNLVGNNKLSNLFSTNLNKIGSIQGCVGLNRNYTTNCNCQNFYYPDKLSNNCL
jgi:hypothetical protein